ncbi:MAG: gpW family head-tail joining protein [Alphaproteobacteria bacterium]|uniref:gpW family head-tail joining protein n=1 Tax=Shimia sp. TaxID=1954381 RepID=UPI003299E547
MTTQEKLDDAKAQYHLLVTGQQAKVFVDQNGERVEYTQANRGALLAYIQRLDREVAGTRPGPMKVIF